MSFWLSSTEDVINTEQHGSSFDGGLDGLRTHRQGFPEPLDRHVHQDTCISVHSPVLVGQRITGMFGAQLSDEALLECVSK